MNTEGGTNITTTETEGTITYTDESPATISTDVETKSDALRKYKTLNEQLVSIDEEIDTLISMHGELHNTLSVYGDVINGMDEDIFKRLTNIEQALGSFHDYASKKMEYIEDLVEGLVMVQRDSNMKIIIWSISIIVFIGVCTGFILLNQ